MLKWQKDSAFELILTMKAAHNALSQLISVPEGSAVFEELREGCMQCADTLAGMDDSFYLDAAFYKTALNAVETPDEALLLDYHANNFALLLERVKIKLEFVFFSYKTSMFDSFETVVRACNDDPHIEAFVVPIPYFDKNKDKSPGKMHFEEMKNLPQYADLNIVDYRNYDVKARRPDVIFINNPYDNYNGVTSVHPNFYAENLAGFTEILAYIPYFVLPELEEPSVMVPKHFVETYGCIFADRVFVQSEIARLGYVHHYRDVVKNLANSESLLKNVNKFIAAGSPKFEKTLTDKEDAFIIPDDWKAKIYKADGSKKAVFFLNTGISNFLPYTTDHTRQNVVPDYLEMLDNTLKTFEKRDDCVLLWRPHPLAEATVKSARPALYDSYKEIVDNYINKDFGIYDLSEDFHPAFAVSDAFVGDPSSIVNIFSLSGKPSVLTSIFDCSGRCFPDAHISVDGYCYFTLRGYAKLFRTNEEGKAEAIADLNCESDFAALSFSGMAHCGGKIYIAPKSASEILIYDIKDNTVEAFEYNKSFIPSGNVNSVSGDKFCGVFADDESVYFIGKCYPAIIKYNTLTGEKTYFRDYVKKLSGSIPGSAYKNKLSLINNFAFENDRIYTVSDRFAGLMETDTKTGKTKFITVGGIERGVSAIAVQSGKAYLGDFYTGKPIVVFDIKKREIVEKIALPEGFDNPYYKDKEIVDRFSSFAVSGGKLYVFPHITLQLLEVDLCNYSVRIIESFDVRHNRDEYKIEFTDNRIVFSKPNKTPTISEIKNGRIHNKKLEIDISKLPYITGKTACSINLPPFAATSEFTLDDFADGVVNGLYKDKTYFDDETKNVAEYNLKSSKRIIENCKKYLKERRK
jgi:hypothetical protein